MNADTRMAASLVLSLLIASGNLRLAMAGQADIVAVGVRYVAGFLVCFLLVGILGRLYNSYLAQLDESDEPVDAPPVHQHSGPSSTGEGSDRGDSLGPEPQPAPS